MVTPHTGYDPYNSADYFPCVRAYRARREEVFRAGWAALVRDLLLPALLRRQAG